MIIEGQYIGPHLIRFINDMLLNMSTSIDMGAGDSAISVADKRRVNDFQELLKWREENKMSINGEQPKIMIITTRHK